MHSELFPWVLLAAAALVALWLAVWFPSLIPRSARGVFARTFIAAALIAVTAPCFDVVAGITGGATALVLVTFPCGVALLLALGGLLLWVGRLTQAPSN